MNQPATIHELQQNNAAKERAIAPVSIGFGSLQGFELMQRVGKVFSSSNLVPKQYQGNLANCMIALNMANRIGADEMQVMQNLYIVHGNPSWSAKFLVATFNQSGRFSPIRYRWTKEDQKSDDYGCQAYATDRETGEEVFGPWITWKLVKAEGWHSKNGSKWNTMPEKMFMYRAAAWMIDTVAPEISMGLRTIEEEHDTYDARPTADGTFTVDELRSEQPNKQGSTIEGEAAAEARQQPANDEWPKLGVDEETGEEYWTDSAGEFFDPNEHGWSNANNRPAVKQDGTFKAKRGTQQQEAQPQQQSNRDDEEIDFGNLE